MRWFDWKETRINYVGDGMHVHETDELVGVPVNLKYENLVGMVVGNSAFFLEIRFFGAWHRLWLWLRSKV